jgi:hypothetical protein
MADGDFPFSTIPGLNPAAAVEVTDEVWVNQDGADRRATLAQVIALASGGQLVTSVTSATPDLSVVDPTTTPVLTVNSAPKWTTPRGLSFTGDASGAGSIDGTLNVSIALALAVVNANPGIYGDATHVPRFTVDANGRITAATNVPIAVPSGTVTNVSSTTGDLSVANGTSTPALTVVSAPKWTTARTLSFTGDATGSGSVDGSINVATALTLAAVNANSGTYGDASHVAQVTVNAKGLITGVSNVALPAPGTGTVTSVAFSAPAIFTVTGSPVTGAGTIALGLATQANNLVFAGPLTGGPLAPTFRPLTQADISGGVGATSVGLALPSIFTVTGSPVTGAGTLTGTFTTQAANAIFAGPASGVAAAPAFRALAAADIPSLSGLYLSLTGGTVNGPVTVSGGGTINALTVDGPAGTIRQLGFTTANSLRWQFNVTAAAESGGNAGSNFNLQSLSDTGAFIANAMTVVRSTGLVTLPSGASVAGGLTVTAGGLTVSAGGAAVTGGLTAAGAGPLIVDGAAGTSRNLQFTTAGSLRWQFNVSAIAESGGNAGSNFNLQACSDAGAVIFTPIGITRSTGLVSLFSGASVTGGLAVIGTTARGVLIGQGAAAVTSTAAGAVGAVLTGQGAGADPTFTVAGGTITGFGGPNPAAPGSATATMAGMGASPASCTFTPTRNGRVLLMFTGYIITGISSAAGAGVQVGLYYGTGAAPANGAALTGTSLTSSVIGRQSNAAGASFQNTWPFHLCAFVTGLAVGTTYWADLSQALTLAGAAANLANVNFTWMEQ